MKQLRDAGSSWSEIAKTFPARTEGSVKKHWYKVRLRCPAEDARRLLTMSKDMHYADFAEDEVSAFVRLTATLVGEERFADPVAERGTAASY